MKDYQCRKKASLIETGRTQNISFSLKGIEKTLIRMEKINRRFYWAFTIGRTCMAGTIAALLLLFFTEITGRRALFLAYVLPVLTGTGVLTFLVGTTTIPRPFGVRSLETAVRLQEILVKENPLDTIKISKTGLVSISRAEEGGIHTLFEEYLPVVFSDTQQPAVESFIEYKNRAREGAPRGYHIRMVLPWELNNGIGEDV